MGRKTARFEEVDRAEGQNSHAECAAASGRDEPVSSFKQMSLNKAVIVPVEGLRT